VNRVKRRAVLLGLMAFRCVLRMVEGVTRALHILDRSLLVVSFLVVADGRRLSCVEV